MSKTQNINNKKESKMKGCKSSKKSKTDQVVQLISVVEPIIKVGDELLVEPIIKLGDKLLVEPIIKVEDELLVEPIIKSGDELLVEPIIKSGDELLVEPINELVTKQTSKKIYEKVKTKLSSEELYKSINEQRTKLVENWVNNLLKLAIPIIQKAINDDTRGPYYTVNVTDGIIGHAFGRSVNLTRQLNQDVTKDGKKTTYHRNFINFLSEKTNSILNTRVFVTIKPVQESSNDFTITWMKYQQKAKIYSSDGKPLKFI